MEMIPSYFPGGSGPLFGVRHPALRGDGPRRGAVLCQPLGPEYVRTHRAFRHLAIQLANRGIEVLRFDYYGSGDSAGGTTEASLERWVGDVCTAAAELRRIGPVDELVMVGLRLGAALALAAAPRLLDVTAVVLWEPVDAGGEHLAELRDSQARWEHRKAWFDSRWEGTAWNGPEDLLGFPATPEFVEELRTFRAWAGVAGGLRRALLVEAEGREGTRRLGDALARTGIDVSHAVVPDARIWNVLQRASALIPRATVERVIEWCTTEAA
jgi:pimeloyl-ACP methyl ester carboxylesterase